LAFFDFLLARPPARELLSEKHRTPGMKGHYDMSFLAHYSFPSGFAKNAGICQGLKLKRIHRSFFG